MLVDDATVEIENIHRNHAMNKPLLVAILDGASQIATPTFVGTLAICIVFFPVVLLTGVARFLFTPLALAVVFAMLTSYLLSRTLVPTMASYLLPEQASGESWHRPLEPLLARFRGRLRALAPALCRRRSTAFIAHRALSLACVALLIVGTLPLLWITGEDFFPTVDAGLMKLHVRAPSGTRIERTEWMVDKIERSIRQIIPADELEQMSDDIDLPQPYAIAFFPSDNLGPQDGEILIQLTPKHHPTAIYQQRIREMMSDEVSECPGLFHGGRHGEPGVELRAAGGDRCADLRQRSQFRLQDRRAARRKDVGDSRRYRSANCRTAGLPVVQDRCRSRQSARTGHHRAAGRIGAALVTERQ